MNAQQLESLARAVESQVREQVARAAASVVAGSTARVVVRVALELDGPGPLDGVVEVGAFAQLHAGAWSTGLLPPVVRSLAPPR